MIADLDFRPRVRVAALRVLRAGLVLALAATLAAAPAAAQPATPGSRTLLAAVVGIDAEIPPEARSAARLGTHREGSGVVVSADGLVLTIGYLILEAASVAIVTQNGNKVPATIVAYDHDSGFGLVRAREPLDLPVAEFGDSDTMAVSHQALIATRLGQTDARGVYVVARREFAGPWEYLLDAAIYTSPPHGNFSGSALFGVDGRLHGIGSLLVGDAAESDRPLPGNMFVPINLLKPVFDRLVADGRRPGPGRPWLGLSPTAAHGRVFVDNVSEDGPAARAGLTPDDLIVAVGATPVASQADFFRAVWASGQAGDTVTLQVLTRAGALRPVPVVSVDRLDWLRLDPTL
jgi:S1-C subfamily serine protease